MSGFLWFGASAFVALTAFGLLACMGMANMMSVNNSSTPDLLRAWPGVWWSAFGEFTASGSLVLAVLSVVILVGATLAGGVFAAAVRALSGRGSPTPL